MMSVGYGETTPRAAREPVLAKPLASAAPFWRALLRTAARTMSSPKRVWKAFGLLAAMLRDYDFQRTALPIIPEDLRIHILSREVSIPHAAMVGTHGGQTVDGLLWLACIAKALRARQVFEIGTHKGVTALVLAANIPEAAVHTLDLPPGAAPGLRVWGTDSVHFLPADTPRAWQGRPEEKRITLHLADSARFEFEQLRGRFDLVYVDGAHSLEYLVKDSDSAFTLVSSRGAIVWDDYWMETPEVVAYLNGRRDLRLFRLPETRLVVWLSAGAEEMIRAGEEL